LSGSGSSTTSPLWRTIAAVVALSVVFVGSSAVAQSPEERDRALELFEESESAYRAGEFERALVLLRGAYELVPDPAIMYNIARSLEGLGRSVEAADAYERYLDTAGDVEDRGAIERRVESLRRQPEPRRSLRLAAPISLIGAGALVAVVGAIPGALSQSRHDQAVLEPEHERAFQLQDQAERLAKTANVLFALGGVVAAGGVVWLVMRLVGGGEEEEEAGLRLDLGPGSLQLRGTF